MYVVDEWDAVQLLLPPCSDQVTSEDEDESAAADTAYQRTKRHVNEHLEQRVKAFVLWVLQDRLIILRRIHDLNAFNSKYRLS